MSISIIIPVRNEADTLYNLITQMSAACQDAGNIYEIIAVDDASTDASLSILTELKLTTPIQIVHHVKSLGKTRSLRDGFAKAKYEIIAMIDSDLQYSPLDLIPMIHAIEKNETDMVVGVRTKSIDFWRTLGRKLFQTIFVKSLHQINVDAYAGIKVFKAEIIDRLVTTGKFSSFDLELITKARHAGYQVATYDIDFHARTIARKGSLHLIGRGIEMMNEAINLKLFPRYHYPFNERQIKEMGQGFDYRGQRFVHHTELPNHESAFHRLSRRQMVILALVLLALALSFAYNWRLTAIVSIAILTVLYFGDLLFNLYLIYCSFARPTEITIPPEKIAAEKEEDWPSYTILCPLYKESHVIPQFVRAMSRLDYPKDKLQVLLLLEEDDKQTIIAAGKLALPDFIHVLVVPDSNPKTKPKACNYGLLHATGEYTTIYDAEDVPDPQQLKKAVLAFRELGDRTVCIQAKLNFYNPKQNLLTRIFTAEYSLWFDLVLTGLHSIGAPIPLGGTSNHFPTEKLKELHGWDAFNVTEDCDLGMRLVKKNYRTAVIDSITYEEANSGLMNWLLQRTRWIKGYIQTYFVHMRHPEDFKKSLKEPHFLTFQLVVGGKILSMIINPLMWVITISYFVFRATFGVWIEQFYPTPVLYMAVFSLIFGNFLYMYYYMIGCAKREYDDLIKYVIFVPFYWLGMSFAAWRAAIEIMYKPHYWSKTKHGLHLDNKKAMAHATKVLQYDLGGTL